MERLPVTETTTPCQCRGYNGEYGVPALPPLPVCECHCGGECHDLIGELGECLACDDCRRYRPVTP
jgi:hypothetical protein